MRETPFEGNSDQASCGLETVLMRAHQSHLLLLVRAMLVVNFDRHDNDQKRQECRMILAHF